MNNSQLYVGKIPNRKRYALYVIEGNQIRILAYFTNDDAVIEYIKYMGGNNE